MADQDDRTFRVPDRPLGGGNVVVQRVERVLDCNDLESGLFEIRNDFLPARPVRKRTMDKDCGLGFQLVSRNWQADRGHRGQEEAQAHNAFVRFHSYVPSFGGDLGVAVVVISTKQSRATNVRRWPLANWKQEEPVDEATPFKQRSNIGSRVTREGHARFWERPEVKFLRATRQHHSSSTTNTGNVSGHAGSARVCQFRTL